MFCASVESPLAITGAWPDEACTDGHGQSLRAPLPARLYFARTGLTFGSAGGIGLARAGRHAATLASVKDGSPVVSSLMSHLKSLIDWPFTIPVMYGLSLAPSVELSTQRAPRSARDVGLHAGAAACTTLSPERVTM